MKTDQIFVGNIRKCTKYELHTKFSSSISMGQGIVISDSVGHLTTDDELYKENAILIKIKNGGYVDLERVHSIFDHIRVYRDITENGIRLGGLIMSTEAHCIDSLFVDRASLKPYYPDKQQTDDISVRQLKKQLKKNR